MNEEPTRRLAAVWFADIVGYTDLSNRDEDAALRLVAELRGAAERLVPASSGRVVKHLGDAVLAVFESAGNAVQSALALRDAFQGSLAARSVGATLRVGVHVGEILTAPDGDIYGDGVNTASRIQGAAAPGQVLLSGPACESLRHRAEFRFEGAGRRRLKGLSRPLELFAASLAGAQGDERSRREGVGEGGTSVAPAPRTHYGRAVAVGLAAGMVGLVALGVFLGGHAGPAEPEAGSAATGEEVAVALSLGIEGYFRGSYEEAAANLALFLEPAGTPEQRRQGLRYLARTLSESGHPEEARAALGALLATEPPLALLIPSLEAEPLMELYFEARRERMRSQGIHDPSQAVRGLVLFDFQLFSPEGETESVGTPEEIGYGVAFLLQTDLKLAGLPALRVEEMSFENRGDDAYSHLDATLRGVSGEGPSHLLTGSVAFGRTGVLLSAWVWELETGRLVVSEQVNGPPEGLLMELPETLARRVVAGLPGAGPYQ